MQGSSWSGDGLSMGSFDSLVTRDFAYQLLIKTRVLDKKEKRDNCLE